jgi:hypothetical protein
MACSPVTIDTFQALFTVISVIETDHSFFNCVTELENIFVTFQASLRSEIIVSQIFRRDKRVTVVPKHIPSFGR